MKGEISGPVRHSLVLAFLFFSFSVLLTAVEPPDFFRVGLTALSFPEGDPESEYYSRSIPLLVYRKLSQITEREVPPGEANLLALAQSRKARFDRISAFGEKRKKRDETMLSLTDEFRKYSYRIKTENELDPGLLLQDPANSIDMVVHSRKTVEFWKDHATGFVIPGANYPTLGEIARKQSLDLVISGRIKEFNGAFFLEIQVYNAIREKVTFSYETVFPFDAIELTIDDIAMNLCESVSGHVPARLTVETGHPDAMIYIDGKLAGTGTADSRFLKPGTHSVEILSGIFLKETRSVVVLEGAPTVLTVNLVKKEKRGVEIQTVPEAASIYHGVEYSGISPCILDFFDEANTCSAVFPDGETVFFTVYPRQNLPVIVEKPNPRSMTFKTAKDQFYDSLGWFMLGTIATSVSSGIYQQYYNDYAFARQAYSNGLIDDVKLQKAIQELSAQYAAWQYVSLGSAVVTGGFFVLAGFRLADYISAAKR